MRALEGAVAEARDGAPATTLARALGKHAVARAYAQELAEARDSLAEAERLVLLKASSLRAEACVWRAQIAGVSGDLGDRRSSYWAAVELYRESGDLRLAAGAAMNLADTYNQLGVYDEAERALVSARADCLALGVRVMAGYAALNLGYARTELGSLEEAARSLDEARAIAEESKEERLARFVELYRARVDRRAGRLASAATTLAALSSRARADRDEGMHALAESALARVHLEAGDADEALASSERALAALTTLGALEEGEAELHWTRARCLAAVGRDAEADAARARGAELVRALARRIGDAEWRARLLEDVEPHRALLAQER
jgi:tetratricopeptide (TPR) repeat protein